MQLVHCEFTRPRALCYCERLAKTISHRQIKIAIQNAIGPDHRPHHHQSLPQGRDGEVLRGDITRKSKLLEKQKEGKLNPSSPPCLSHSAQGSERFFSHEGYKEQPRQEYGTR